ncbi:MAG: DEAD/DEAH box helicase [Desulfosalsimonas sp.]
MIPRPYQQKFVDKALRVLHEKGNTLGVAPTGAGKTLMIAWILEQIGGKQLVLQHREELVNQNRTKFSQIVKDRSTSVCGLGTKDTSGDTIFGMVQTLGRNGGAKQLPPLDVLFIDEAHHGIADTYRRVVDTAREKNPNCLIAGVTATPARGDKKGLSPIFDNVCEQITLKRLVDLGFLVPPRTFIASLPGVADQLQDVRKLRNGEYDMDEIDTLMNTRANNKAVIREWERLASDRKTIIFCSTVKHAKEVSTEFQRHGVKADCVFGETPNRAEILERFDKGDLQVLVNVAVLTEGYDSQPVSCVILLRPCSYKSTMLQMIGRGLRTVDPEEYPGVVKKDCLILDFGESLKVYGSLEQAPQLEDKEAAESPVKNCPQCESEVPISVQECPICGYAFPPPGEGQPDDEETADVVLTELDIMKMSPFKWVDLFDTGKVMMASGFNAWVTACAPQNDWIALGKVKGGGMKELAVGDKRQAMAAADDFLRVNEDSDAAKKSKRWLRDPATFKQLDLLQRVGWPAKQDFNLQKYHAACLLNFLWNKETIERRLFND